VHLRRSSPFIFACILLAVAGPVRAQLPRTLTVGWYDWPPYSMRIIDGVTETLTGVDIEIARQLFAQMGIVPDFVRGDFETLIQGLERGEVDVVFGAMLAPEREVYASFSAPYRVLDIRLFVPRDGRVHPSKHRNLEELLEDLARQQARIGSGFPGRVETAFRSHPVLGPLLAESGFERELIEDAASGSIDGVLGSRLAAHTLIRDLGLAGSFSEYPLDLGNEPVHAMFSRATVSPEVVTAFNREIANLETSGGTRRIARHYLLPVVLSQTISAPWFFWIEVFGTVAFALSGLILARREDYDVVGALVLAALPAMGGGIVRDLILNRHPVWIFRSPVFALIVLGTVVVGYPVLRIASAIERKRGVELKMPEMLVEVTDAIGLSAFIVGGVLATLEVDVEPLWLWGTLMAGLTGAGGGIIRDVVRHDAGNPLIKGTFYEEIALIWGCGLAVFLTAVRSDPSPTLMLVAVLVTMAGAFTTRMVAIAFKVKSPLF
jgi:polar amino acid transport system substrate-binding protein